MPTPTLNKRPSLCLRVEGTVGSNIEDCMKEACALAVRMGLAWVTFKFNGYGYTCYDFGKVIRFREESCAAEMWTGTEWISEL